ncbi:MAG TPA: tetratricopeptide repeat protein, partial [Flavobacteriales bacterium]|nr:tetratricopeptide repeat protein [Flavobacteriales bacterium]
MVFTTRALALFIALVSIGELCAQPLDTLHARLRSLPLDSLVQRAKTNDDPRAKFVANSALFARYLFLDDQQECMRYAMRSLELAEQLKNDTLLSRAHSNIGGAFAVVNNVNAALDRYNTSFRIAEHTGDSLQMAFVCKEIAVLYNRVGDTEGALRYMHRALAYGMTPSVRARGMSVMARCYLELGQLDSAYYCAREADIIKEPGKDPYGYSHYQGILAAVYAARKEPDLAETYFKRAVAVADSFDQKHPLINAASGYAKLLIEQGRTAEALAMARKGFQATEGTRQPRSIVTAADGLAKAFHAVGMDDSAFVYSQLCNAYRDTVTNTQNRGQMQSQLFARELKDREDAKLREEAAAARSRNIQFGIIALIVITLGIFLLIFSRSSVVGAKAIKNLSLIALLLFFEFINLLIHPFLDRITNHSPILMLLCMAAIAG